MFKFTIFGAKPPWVQEQFLLSTSVTRTLGEYKSVAAWLPISLASMRETVWGVKKRLIISKDCI